MSASYVGADMCVECHEGYQEKLAMTQHGKTGFAKLSERGCEACHGPGSLHLDDPEAYAPRVTDKSPSSSEDRAMPGGTSTQTSTGSTGHPLSRSTILCFSIAAASAGIEFGAVD